MPGPRSAWRHSPSASRWRSRPRSRSTEAPARQLIRIFAVISWNYLPRRELVRKVTSRHRVAGGSWLPRHATEWRHLEYVCVQDPANHPIWRIFVTPPSQYGWYNDEYG